jgi:hypothetical protein
MGGRRSLEFDVDQIRRLIRVTTLTSRYYWISELASKAHCADSEFDGDNFRLSMW